MKLPKVIALILLVNCSFTESGQGTDLERKFESSKNITPNGGGDTKRKGGDSPPPSKELEELLAAQRAIMDVLNSSGKEGQDVIALLNAVRNTGKKYYEQLREHPDLKEQNRRRSAILAEMGSSLKAGQIDKVVALEADYRSLSESIKAAATEIEEIEAIRVRMLAERENFLARRDAFFRADASRLIVLNRLLAAEKMVKAKKHADNSEPKESEEKPKP